MSVSRFEQLEAIVKAAHARDNTPDDTDTCSEHHEAEMKVNMLCYEFESTLHEYFGTTWTTPDTTLTMPHRRLIRSMLTLAREG